MADGGTNTRLEKSVGLLRRLIWRSKLVVTAEYHDLPTRRRMCIRKHSATQVSESTPVIADKGPSFAPVGISGPHGGDESEERRTSTQARHGYEDWCKTDARAAMGFEGQPWRP